MTAIKGLSESDGEGKREREWWELGTMLKYIVSVYGGGSRQLTESH
jgi:hypothetical protein